MISRNCKYLLGWGLTLVVLSNGQHTGSAIEEFQGLQTELRKSHGSGNWRSYLAGATRMKALLNDAPDSLLEVARAEAHVGDLQAAFQNLEQFVRMGQSTELLATLPDFAALRDKKDFVIVQDGMKANRSRISLSRTAFPLADPESLAEDVDHDPNTKRFFITSVREKKIIATDASGSSREFAKSPDGWPMVAIKIDAVRGLLWATEVAMQGLIFSRESDWGRSAVLCYDLKSGELRRRIEGPKGSALGDMVLARNGDVIVSDGDGGGVYRVTANANEMERLDGGDFISPQTPAMHPNGKHIFVPDYVRGIGLLEISSKRVQWLSMNGTFALNGIDGLYFDHGKLIAVQNGTSPERVIVFTLDATLTKIRSEKIIERSTETLGDPTHGVIVDRDFYYIANSGWDAIDDHGNLKPGAKLSTPRIMRFQLNGADRHY
jgi:hypothetical protein